MVEGDHPVIEPDGQVGELKLVRARAREAFEMMTQVVAKDSRRPTLKRRQAGNPVLMKMAELLRQHSERLGRLLGRGRAADAGRRTARPDPGERICGNKGVAPEGRMPIGAIEEK